MALIKQQSRDKLLRIGFPIVVALGVGVIGTRLLLSSHADSFITLYKMYYPPGGTRAVYYTTDAADARTHTNSGWKTSGTYGYVNEAGSSPIPVYWAHQVGTTNNYFTSNSATIPGGYKNYGVKFYESSSSKVPYGYCRSTASGFKLDYTCSTNPAPKPAPPTPTPTPTPTPAPPPDDTGGGDDTGPSDDSGAADVSNADDSLNTSPTAVSNAADGTASAGTITASINVPAGGASTVHVNYGTDPANLSSSTDDQDTAGTDTTINLDSLDAQTTYQYVIVRTADDGTTATSGPSSFQTKGYTISLHFIDAKKKGVAGIKGNLDNDKKTKGTSDKGGTMSFTDLPRGTYKVTYSYQGKTHTDEFDTDNASIDTDNNSTADNTPQVAVLADTIDLSRVDAKLGVGAGEATKSSKGGIIGLLLLVLVVGGAIFWILRRRRKARRAAGGVLPAPYDPRISKTDIIDHQMNAHFQTAAPAPLSPAAVPATISPVPAAPAPLSPAHTKSAVKPAVAAKKAAPAVPEHMGESLRDMVLKSMHEEAQKKRPPPQA